MESSELVVLSARAHGERGVMATVYTQAHGLLTLLNYRDRLPGSNGNLQALLYPLALLQVNYTLRYGSSTLGQVESVEGRIGRPFYATGFRVVVQQLLSELLWRLLRGGGEGIPQGELYACVREAAHRFPAMGDAQLQYMPSFVVLSLLCAMGYRPGGEFTAHTPYFDVVQGCFASVPPMGFEGRKKVFSKDISAAWQKMLTFGYEGLQGLGDAVHLLFSVLWFAEYHLQQELQPKTLQLFTLSLGGGSGAV